MNSLEEWMKKEHARLTVLLDAERKAAFEELCAALGTTPSEVVRSLIENYVKGDKRLPDILQEAANIRRSPRRHERTD